MVIMYRVYMRNAKFMTSQKLSILSQLSWVICFLLHGDGSCTHAGGDCILDMNICPTNYQLYALGAPNFVALGLPPEPPVFYVIQLFGGTGLPSNYQHIIICQLCIEHIM